MEENKNSNPEEQQYKRLFEYHKHLVDLTAKFLVVAIAVFAFLFYQDRKQMKEDLSKSSLEMKEQVKEVKDLSISRITETKNYADSEIERVRSQTQSLAIEKTQRELDYLFSSDKMQGYIRDRAVNTARTQISEIVDSTVVPKFKETEETIYLLGQVADAAIRARIGHIEGYRALQQHASSDNFYIKKSADRYITDIENDYSTIRGMGVDSLLKIGKPEFSLLGIPQNKDEILLLIKNLSTYRNLNDISFDIILINRLTGKNFKVFDVKSVQKWAEQLERSNEEIDLKY